MSSGNKYHRFIYDLTSGVRVTVDVYAVIEAFAVTCPARQHALKKLLCAGLRGKGDAVQDLKEAGDAIARAVGLEEMRVWHAQQHDAVVMEQIAKATSVPVGSLMQTLCSVCGRVLYYTDGLQPMPTFCDDCASKTQTAL